MNVFENDNVHLLIKALLSLSDEDECKRFLEDIMTTKELISISQRIQVAKMLCENCTYNEVAEVTSASSATIGRVNRCIQYGNGGYKEVLKNIGCLKQDGE